MIRIRELRLPLDHPPQALAAAALQGRVEILQEAAGGR